MGLWSTDASGSATLAGDSVRTVFMANTTMSANSAYTLDFTAKAHEPAILILASPDGRSGYEIGIVGANIVVRRVTFGSYGSALATAAHGLGAAVPGQFQARLVGTSLTAYLNGSDTPMWTYDLSTDTGYPSYLGYMHWGFAATVNGARVVRAQQCSLVPVRVTLASVLIAIAGDEIWAAVDRTGITRIASRALNDTGDVSMTAIFQEGFIVDGAHFKVVDPVNLTVSDFVASDGTPPGYTGPGTTSSTMAFNDFGRLGVNDRQNEQNLSFSAIDDTRDFNDGSFVEGAAFSLSAAKVAGIGEPVRCFQASTDISAIIGCDHSMWQMRGDPSLPGSVSVTPLCLDSGVSGKDAMTLADEGKVYAHGTKGLCVIEAGIASFPSENVLTDLIQIENAVEDYLVQVIREPGRHGAWIFLTTKDGSDSIHLWCDERVSKLLGGGGFFPQQFPNWIGPTSSVLWNGELVLGTRDGRLMVFDDAAVGSDDGSPIQSRCPLALMITPDLRCDTVISEFNLVLDAASLLFTVFAGTDAQNAYEGPDRWQVLSRTLSGRRPRLTQTMRGPALIAQIANNTLGVTWAMETGTVEYDTAPLTRRAKTTRAAPEAPCRPPTTDGGGGGGGGGPTIPGDTGPPGGGPGGHPTGPDAGPRNLPLPGDWWNPDDPTVVPEDDAPPFLGGEDAPPRGGGGGGGGDPGGHDPSDLPTGGGGWLGGSQVVEM